MACSTPESTRLPWSRPLLVVHGSVAELTGGTAKQKGSSDGITLVENGVCVPIGTASCNCV